MAVSLGLVIYSAVKPIFKIYFIIGMGYFLAKRNILTVTTCRDISDLVVTALMPCLIFNNIVSYLQSSDIKLIGIVFFEGTILLTVGALLALLTYYVCKSPKAWFGGLICVGLFPNISDLPIAYLQTMVKTGSLFTAEESEKGAAYVCIFLASQVFYQFSLGLHKLVRYDFRDQLNAPDSELKIGTSGNTGSADTTENNARASGKHESHLNVQGLSSQSRPGLAVKYSDDSGWIDSSEQYELEAKLLTYEATGENIQHNGENGPTDLGHSNSAGLHILRCRLSSVVIDNPLHMTRSRNADALLDAPEDMKELIHEYSEFQRLKTHVTHNSETGIDDVRISEEIPGNATTNTSAVLLFDSVPSSNARMFMQKFKARAISTLKNFLAPNSVALITSLVIAMAPPLKALFVVSSFPIPSAPDEQPPLSFVIDIASYMGAASVPLGLLVLGATIARLKVTAIVPGFWKTAVMITACRLIIMLIFGVGLTTGIQQAGWFGHDRLVRFVSVLEFGLPSATALVYFTAFYTDPDSPDHLQMDCLAICLIAQYSILFISLPFLVTFTLKVSMGF